MASTLTPALLRKTHTAATHRVEAESDLALITQEWLLQVDLNLDQKPSPPVRPPRHKRNVSTPSKLTMATSANASEPTQLSRVATRAGTSPTHAKGETVLPRVVLEGDVPESLEVQQKKWNGSAISAGPALVTVPEEHTLSLPPGRHTPNSSDPDWAHVPPRPDSAMSVSAFVPVSTHDYPYMYLLGWPTYYAGNLEEKEWVIGFDEARWEEERQKAYEWIRLKKITRRVATAKRSRALWEKESGGNGGESQAA
ncbi:hypothetical protein CALVIDRAFT_561297 [Calocera viscosa TUFC12733]|uniref:Uncharacterized protein n=1 Tax=Calocera viscosa (strain TUFC12733) TaxID=1330018 RepID=A0A167Q5P6_CALVF|nr:hypothetical protein CALVIDRAFT_561297 [Calocera viscosa TUFC12733]